jgi:hypothetical protein
MAQCVKELVNLVVWFETKVGNTVNPTKISSQGRALEIFHGVGEFCAVKRNRPISLDHRTYLDKNLMSHNKTCRSNKKGLFSYQSSINHRASVAIHLCVHFKNEASLWKNWWKIIANPWRSSLVMLFYFVTSMAWKSQNPFAMFLHCGQTQKFISREILNPTFSLLFGVFE